MIRKIILGFCLSCALLISLAALVLVLQDANEYKPEIETWLSTQVGSDVSIEGEINLSIYPWIGLRVERVRIANPPAYGDQPLVSAAGAVIRMRLGPLLRDRAIVLDRLVLDRPVITLRRHADGSANWHALLRRFGMMADQRPPSFVQGPEERPSFMSEPAGWTLKAEDMRGVSIVGGRVQYIADATDESLVVDQLYLKTGPGAEFDYELRFRVDESVSGLFGVASLKGSCVLDPDAPSMATRGADFEFKGSASYAGEILTGTISGKLDLDTAAGRVALRQAVADTDFVHAELSVEAPLPLGAMPMTGKMQLALRDAGILTRVWREVQDGEGPHYLEGLLLRTEYRVEEERVQLEGLHVEAAGMKADGRGELLLGAEPQASILLDIPAIALDSLSETGGESSPEWLAALLEGGALPDLSPLKSLRLGVDAEAVAGYGLDLRQLSMDLDMRADRARMDIQVASVFDGSLDASMDLAPDNVAVEISAEHLDLDPLAVMLRQQGVIADDADFPEGTAVLDMRAKARSPGELLDDGSLEISGRIAGGSFSTGKELTTAWADLEFSANREAARADTRNAFAVRVLAREMEGKYAENAEQTPEKSAASKNGEVAWRIPSLRVSLDGALAAVPGGGFEINDVRYDLKAEGEGGAWSLPGPGRLRNGVGELRLTSHGTFSLDPGMQRIIMEDMETEGFGLVVTGHGVLDYGEEWSLQGTLGLPEFAPRVCMAYLGIATPEIIEPGLLASCNAQAEVEARTGWIRFHNLNIHVDESTGRGEFTFSEIRKGGPEWGVSFDLRVDALDADRYLFGHPHPQTATTTSAQKSETWDLDWLKEIRSRGRLRIGELELFDLYYHNVDVTSEIGDSTLVLEPFTAGFYNGMLRLGIRGEVGDTLAMAVDLELEKFDLLGVLEKVGDWDRMGGEASIVMHLASEGLSSAEHLRSLSGGGDVMVDNGFYAYTKETVKTENEKMLWREMYKNQRDGNEKADEEEVEEQRVVIPVNTARATIQIQDGIFSNKDFIAKGKTMTATGSGTMDIPRAILDYTILVDAKVIPVFPVHIQGPLADPAVEEGGIGFVETLFTTFRNILTIPFSAMDALSRKARQLQKGENPGNQNPGADSEPGRP